MVVIVILGVLAASVMPRFLGANDLKGAGYRDQILSALRYAQKAAVSHRRLVCATVNGSGVNLTIATVGGASSCSAGSLLAGPGGTGQLVSNPDGFGISPASTTLYFQPWGQVTSDGAGTTTASFTLTVTSQAAITVDGRTGYAG